MISGYQILRIDPYKKKVESSDCKTSNIVIEYLNFS